MAPSVVLPSRAKPYRFFRRLATLLLASTLVLLLGGTALASIDASRPMMAQATAERSWVPGDAPDLSFVVADALVDGRVDPVVTASVVPSLAEVPGVTAVAVDSLDNGRVAIHVSLVDDVDAAAIDAVEATASRLLDGKQVSVGGRAAIDRDLLDRMHRSALIAVIPVIVLLGLIVAASVGIKLGLTAAGVVALASGLGAMFGARVAGPFDGTLASTAIPAVFIAVLVSCVLTFRLLDWFRHPQGADQAEVIRRSVRHLLPEAGLLFGGLVATAIVMELTGPGRASSTVVAAGGIIAAIVTLGSLPALLVTLPPVPNDDDYKLFRLPTPDGRDFPLPVLAGFACFLLALGLFATRAPSDNMLDGDALPSGEASRRVAEQLVQSGGDPTDAIVASISSSEVDERALDAWASTVSGLSTVGWVETVNGRYVGGSLTASTPTPDRFIADGTTFAIISPLVSGRSAAALALVDEVTSAATPTFSPSLAGVPVDALETAAAASSGLWVLVLMLALTGGLAVYFLLSDLFLAAATVALRLLGTAASIGVYSLLTSDVSGSELQVLALVVNVGVGLFEIGFLRRIGIGLAESGSPDVLIGDALRREGRAAMFGLGVTALIGLAFVSSDVAMQRSLGVAVAVGIVIELLVGMWLLRPVVQGERAAGIQRERSTFLPETLVQDRPSFMKREVAPADITLDAEPEWRRIVGGLLRAEFDCQAEPAKAALAGVFVEETPLFEEVSNHNRRLIDTGLRVQGDGPKLRSLEVVNTSSPIAISVTVEHPRRYLIDASDRQIGQRTPEIREGMLWLMQDPSGRYRIAEAIDLGEADVAIEPSVELDLSKGRRRTDVVLDVSEDTSSVVR